LHPGTAVEETHWVTVSARHSIWCRRSALCALAVVFAFAAPAAPAWAFPPETTIDSGPPAATNSPSATFAFSSSAPGSTFKCKLDSAAEETCTSPKTYPSVSEGQHTFSVYAAAGAAGPDLTPATHTWKADFTPPDTTMTNAPPPATNSPNATFEWTSNEASGSSECSMNGAPYSACSSPVTYMGLGDGTRTFAARVMDAAGNADPTPAQVTWTVDAQPPDTSITSGPSGPSNLKSPTFEFTAGEAATFECMLDNGPASACTTSFTTPALGDGPHTFQVRAIDGVGNPDPTPATRSWTIDTIAPAKPVVWVDVPVKRAKGSARALRATARWQTQDKVRLHWTGTGATGFDVYVRTIAPGQNASLPQPTKLKSHVGAGDMAATLVPGYTYCFTAKAGDAAGNTSDSNVACTTLPYKAESFARLNNGWGSKTGSAHMLGQYVTPKPNQLQPFVRARVGLPPVASATPMAPPFVKRVVLVATRCPSCGKVRVLVGQGPGPPGPNATLSKIVDLYAKTTKHRSVIPIVTWPNTNGNARRWVFVQALTGTTLVDGLGFSSL
jgi:hypothetical protein